MLNRMSLKLIAGEKDSGSGLFRTFEDFEFRAGFFRLLWSVPA
jgi:hypothetical protein